MRASLAALLLGLIPAALASEDTTFDRQLALGAARPYVESWLRWHPVQTGHLNWGLLEKLILDSDKSVALKRMLKALHNIEAAPANLASSGRGS